MKIPWLDRPNLQLNYRFWGLAIPLILSNISVALLGLVDTAVSGHLPGAQYLGGVALGGSVFSFLYWGFNFLRMGTGGLAAQAVGRNDPGSIRTTLAQALLLAGFCSIVLLLLQQPIIDLALHLFAPSAAVAEQTRLYFSVRIWATPAALANFVMLGWFIGLQKGRAALYLLLTVNGVNTLLDIWLVIGLGWGVEGVAAASVVGEVSGSLLALFLVRTVLPRYPGQSRMADVMDTVSLKKLFHTHHHLFVRTMALLSVFAFMNAQSARMGDTVIAATAVIMNFYLLASFALDGLANSAEALVGEAVGASNRAYLLRVVKLSLVWGLVVALLFSAGYLLAGHHLYALMTDLPEVRQLLAGLLPWAMVLPLVSFVGFLMDGIFTGATWTRDMRNTVLISTGLVFLPGWYLTLPMAVHGLWLSFVLFNLARGASLGAVFWWRMRNSAALTG